MWLKFKNVATPVIETFHLLLLTLILGNTFHVKQIDDIVVMAATITTFPTTALSSSSSAAAATTTKTVTTHPLATAKTYSETAFTSSLLLSSSPSVAAGAPRTGGTSASASASLLSLSTLPLPHPFTALWETSAANSTTKLLNLSTNTADAITTDSNEIDIMDNDKDYEAFQDKDYIMTKHIDLSDELSTRRTEAAVAPALDPVPATMSSKSISTSPSRIVPTLNVATPSTMTTSRHRHLKATKNTMATNVREPPSASSLVNHRLYGNKSHFDDLSSLSLLSLQDTFTTDLVTSSSSSSATLSSMTGATTTPTTTKYATALRIKGDEQTMHNTNSHLSVDNVNATIVANINSSSPHNQHRHHAEQEQQQPQDSNGFTSTTAAGHSNRIGIAGTTKTSVSNSNNTTTTTANTAAKETKDNFMTATLSIGGDGNKTNTTAGSGTTRISARKVEHKHILPKSHKTDAPMLNYIFDTFSSANKHHHHDQRYGPHFEDVQLVGKPTNMTVQAGSSIHLNCRISLLQDKTVSWVRRNPGGENALDLLTVGLNTYTGDKRYKMEFQYPNNWRLKIINVKKDDEATYECQISTHPPRVIQINLHVNAPKVMIVDEFGDPLQEKYYEQDSTLQLSCVVRNVAMSTSVVFWKHSEDILNYDVTRGGISVKTELMDDGANSTLFIAKINKADSGNYTCSISEYQNYTIVVHILNGESFAELHHGNAICWQCPAQQTWTINLIVLTTILLLLPAYLNR
ncbi:defective proboscis extension response 20 [Musca autumnalis]|uniref:defective proboscis extension response 20 n=1 Tax=Musca autumnalis TaxID=221902 RepID=UPI003CF06323